jgi:nucleotide-binding universal stress UspA family protein
MSGTKHMVVGLDGSSGSLVALRWAAARTDRFGIIEPVAAWVRPWWAAGPTSAGSDQLPSDNDLRERAQAAAEHLLQGVDPAVVAPVTIVNAPPGPALVAAAGNATLLVVGSRGHGAVMGALLGSVSLHCVNHSTAPVAVIPDDAYPDDPFGRVLVGVDGSPASVAALAWAMATTPAAMAVDALFVWSHDTPYAEEALLAGIDVVERSEDVVGQTIAAARNHERLARATQSPGPPDSEPGDGSEPPDGSAPASVEPGGRPGPVAADREVGVVTMEGDPRQVLRAESLNADLLVVGARGRRGLAHLLLGSVATSAVHGPKTPTVVVR